MIEVVVLLRLVKPSKEGRFLLVLLVEGQIGLDPRWSSSRSLGRPEGKVGELINVFPDGFHSWSRWQRSHSRGHLRPSRGDEVEDVLGGGHGTVVDFTTLIGPESLDV